MKIPKKAKQVFSGIVYDIYQWQETNFDGSTATFEAAKRHDSVQIIPSAGNKVFIGREQQPGRSPFYSFFGGRVEDGESPLAAAKRELSEESGLVSDDWELIRTYDAPGRMQWRIHYYAARDCRFAKEQALDAGERIEVLRLSFRSFLTLLEHEEFRGTEQCRLWLSGRFDAKKVAALRKQLL